ncbi:Aste57867_4469 [Aphanomyces stellatus]|uniref:Aste57867_4469 protein n=1 Tax=Aphanomyces stellatus TaxID=120398 RepID=A0A485KCP7_9STRA|nr:hypothetical protein As57867_004457 [Aphanomyces stellatus]VFT81580.1 Aste57867_4469 [Aphanomyces stellatus]
MDNRSAVTVFHAAIKVGNAAKVKRMLFHDARLAHAIDDVSPIMQVLASGHDMVSQIARLLQRQGAALSRNEGGELLRRHGALVNGVPTPTTELLLDLLAGPHATSDWTNRLVLCIHHQHVALVIHFWSYLEAEVVADRGGRCDALLHQMVMDAIMTRNEDLVLAILEASVPRTWIQSIATGRRAFVLHGHVVDVTGWLAAAVRVGAPRVVAVFARLAYFGPVVFSYCHYHRRSTHAWARAMCASYEADTTFARTRHAFLVQRRRVGLPDEMGRRIAAFLFVFDAEKEASMMWCAVCRHSCLVCGCDAAMLSIQTE